MGHDRSRYEILSPAGNPDKLRAAVNYGADAVYLSGQSYGLRAFSDNFNEDEMKAGIAYAHDHGVKCYVTLNVMPTEEDLAGLEHAVRFVGNESGADAVLVSDPGVFTMVRTLCPDLEIHISTQASVTHLVRSQVRFQRNSSTPCVASSMVRLRTSTAGQRL